MITINRTLSSVSGAVTCAALALAGTAAAAPHRSYAVKYVEKFNTTHPSTAKGVFLKSQWLGDRPSEKPHTIIDDIFRLDPGARFDFSVPAVCHATNRQIYLKGVAACPRASRVAFGEVDLDIGASVFVFPRVIRSHVTVFNGGPGKLIDFAVSFNTGIPIPAVDRPTVTGTGILTENPTLRGVPPPDKFVAVKSDLFHFFKITKGGKGFITTPRTCPPSGFWTNTLFSRYHGGKANTVSSRSRCTSS
jgi:hypothetical protein